MADRVNLLRCHARGEIFRPRGVRLLRLRSGPASQAVVVIRVACEFAVALPLLGRLGAQAEWVSVRVGELGLVVHSVPRHIVALDGGDRGLVLAVVGMRGEGVVDELGILASVAALAAAVEDEEACGEEEDATEGNDDGDYGPGGDCRCAR